jgi:acylphosphatase
MGTSSLAAAEIFVEGRVQGVGYRAWAQRRASGLGLAGYVMNLADGRVRIHAEGERTVIEDLIRQLEEGPRLARVVRVHATWGTPSGMSTFDVRYVEGMA